ncbi:MAG: FAD-dependent oxidoreductase [Sandaracinaceae bacterium]
MSDVTIIGGGPVGLLLALRLHALGQVPRVIERRVGPREGSRSIGVHPPSLERLDRLGLGARFTARGVRVRRGRAYLGARPLGVLDFGVCRGEHRYVLSIPQRDTERILREALEERSPGALREGTELVDVEPGASAVRLRLRRDGTCFEEDARWVVGCDGRRSRVREACAIPVDVTEYPGRYAMFDAPDRTGLGEDAAIFLHSDGLVETFPLPGARRRWVVRRDADARGASTQEELREAIERRTGYLVRDVPDRASDFVTERRFARRFAEGRVALVGDAAHVISPIGGQGMNLGWMGAWSLASALGQARALGPGRLRGDAIARRRSARAAARRAELDMWLGRPGASMARARCVASLLKAPFDRALGRVFTMRGLAFGV